MVDIGGLIHRLAPLVVKMAREEYNLLNTKSEAENLSSNLEDILKVMGEAEQRRLTDPRVRSWLERLHDVTYEIDDALDEWETANRELQIQHSEDGDHFSKTWWKKASIFMRSLLNMSELKEKVDLIAKETATYSLLPTQDFKGEMITTSFSDLVVLKDQENLKKKLVDDLLSPGEETGDFQVISLVGMAGIGKTTLAQLAFRDPRVQSHFKLKSWICVSHVSDKIHIPKTILQSIHVSYPEDAELQMLLELIVSSISGTKFLIVLDYVWIEDHSIWKQLKDSLSYGAPGSRILVTTRNLNVPKLIGSSRVIAVDPLSKSDCWLLFSGIAFHGRGKKEIKRVKRIGKRIAVKCEGMPLAAKTLADYLSSRYSKKLWVDVLEKEVWELEEVAKALFAPLAFDYCKLPPAMKYCFSYCSTFRKNALLKIETLLRDWVCGIKLFSSGTDNEMESKALEYFEVLTRRSCFLQVEEDDEGLKWCRIHGILHEFARYLAKTGSKIPKNRSFTSEDPLSSKELGSLKSVRLLSLQGCLAMQELHPEVGELIHLRYLDLGHTQVEKLPTTICNLYNLQSLDLQDCKQLSELPEWIHRLRNLKHLLNSGTSSLKRLPRGLGKLTSLQTLDEIRVGRGMDGFELLAELNQLRGSMKMIIEGDLEEQADVVEAEKAQLQSKIHLSDLELYFEGKVRIDVMEALQGPPNLKGLLIDGYKGTGFPDWITSLDKLRNLDLSDCENCSHLPSLGTLPFLEALAISKMKSLESVGPELLGLVVRNDSAAAASIGFPKLRALVFDSCGSWGKWIDISDEEENTNSPAIMPCLMNLSISYCPQLVGLPHGLLHRAKSLERLSVSDCPLLINRYGRLPDGEEMNNDWKEISHIKDAFLM